MFRGERSHGGDEIEVRTRPARAAVDGKDQPANAAQPILLGEAADFAIDRLGDLLGDQATRVPGEIAKQKPGKQGENDQIDDRQLERRRAKQFAECAHPSPVGEHRHLLSRIIYPAPRTVCSKG